MSDCRVFLSVLRLVPQDCKCFFPFLSPPCPFSSPLHRSCWRWRRYFTPVKLRMQRGCCFRTTTAQHSRSTTGSSSPPSLQVRQTEHVGRKNSSNDPHSFIFSPFYKACFKGAFCASVMPPASNSAQSTICINGEAGMAERRDKALVFGQHAMCCNPQSGDLKATRSS